MLRCMKSKPPELDSEVVELLRQLRITPRQVHDMHMVFQRIRLHDPLTGSTGPRECTAHSLRRMISSKRQYVTKILRCLLDLAGYRENVSWNGFLFVFLQFCTLSKMEMCQVVFFAIVLQMKSFTVHFITTTQIEEFYSDYADCPFKPFNTSTIDFAMLPVARYSLSDFIELTFRYTQLLNPFLHLQRELQRSMPSLTFWLDFDNVKVQNRKIGLDFFRHKRVMSVLDIIRSAHKEVNKALLEESYQNKSIATISPALYVEGNTFKPLEEQVLVEKGFVPLPVRPYEKQARRSRYHERVPDWMQEHLSSNADPLRGLALGTAFEDARPADIAPALPEGWVAVQDPERPKRLYYWNKATDEVSWTPPLSRDPQSVDQAKEIIRGTMGDQVISHAKDLAEGLTYKALARENKERMQAMARTMELDFIRKARTGEQKMVDMVKMLEKAAPCSLLGRST